MTCLWRRSLAAQFICLMLLALGISQGIGFLLSWDERGQALRAAAKGEFFSRTASLALLLETTPPDLQSEILGVSGTAYTRFWISSTEPQDAATWRRDAWAFRQQPPASMGLRSEFSRPKVAQVRTLRRSIGTI